MVNFFSKYLQTVVDTETILYTGSVTAVKGLMIESLGPRSEIGEICTIKNAQNQDITAEVVGFDGTTVKLMAYGETKGIMAGCTVTGSGKVLQVPVGYKMLGRVVDAIGRPIDGKGPLETVQHYPVMCPAPDPYSKMDVNKRIVTGVRAIDSLLACGKGQRLGIFAGSGVGKSSLLSMIARNTNADINVIGLIGERGREVMEFIKRDLGEEVMRRSVVVVATGADSSLCRMRAAFTTTTIAEYFRDQGKDVMLMMDNVTRFCHAQREIGISIGEPPTQSGYPASVWDMLPKLLERTGTNDKGTITAFYTVLVDGDDMNEPVTDKVRGTVDGHIVLSRRLAQERHFPAIDIMASISRCSDYVTGPETAKAVDKIRKQIAIFDQNKDMINAGVYQKGNSAEIDESIDNHMAIENFLIQSKADQCDINSTLKQLAEVSGIEIPEDEYEEDAAKELKTTAELVHEAKVASIENANELSLESDNLNQSPSLSDAAAAINLLGGVSPQKF